MQIRSVIFDIDGTLVNSIPFGTRCFQQAVQQSLNLSYTAAEVQRFFGHPEEDILAGLVPPEELEKTIEIFFEILEQSFSVEGQLVPGIRELIETLAAQSIPLAIVTGRGLRGAEAGLKAMGLRHHFTLVYGGAADQITKAAQLREIVALQGIAPEQALYLGDTIHDMLQTRAAGLWAAGAGWLPSHSLPAEPLDERTFYFDNVPAFSHWLLEKVQA